jgi:hypothetical protein
MRRYDCATMGVYRYFATINGGIPIFAATGNCGFWLPYLLFTPRYYIRDG